MIQTKRLNLVEFNTKYADDLLEAWSDYDVIKYTFTPLMSTKDESIKYINRRISRTDKDFQDAFVIIKEGKAIGICGCTFMDKENLIFGLYYQFARKYWGNGYASEVVPALVQYVFDQYPTATIRAEVVSINPASIAVLKKAGLKQISIGEKEFKRNGFELDLINFSNKSVIE